MKVVTKAQPVYCRTESVSQMIKNRPESLVERILGGKTIAETSSKGRPGYQDSRRNQRTTKLYISLTRYGTTYLLGRGNKS